MFELPADVKALANAPAESEKAPAAKPAETKAGGAAPKTPAPAKKAEKE
jgi:hypothetical protein